MIEILVRKRFYWSLKMPEYLTINLILKKHSFITKNHKKLVKQYNHVNNNVEKEHLEYLQVVIGAFEGFSLNIF